MFLLRTPLCVLLLGGFLLANPAAAAPKAYEMLHYTAKVRKPTFALDYADGHLAASTITVTLKNARAVRLTPDNGAADDKNQLPFHDASGHYEIILRGVDESLEAPRHLLAHYTMPGKQGELRFTRP